MKNIVKLVTVFIFVYTIIFSTIDIFAASTNAKEIAIKYRAYINGDWEAKYRNSGETAGDITDNTIKAMEIMLENTPVNISYQTYDSNNKWGKIVKNGASTANLANGEAIEAIKINIDNLSTYNIKYRVRPEGQEWLPWVSNNEVAGSTELGLGVEAVEIKLVSEEMRAVWLSTVANIDWPASGSTAVKQQNDLKTTLDNIVAMNMNTVVFQVSPTSDAFYKSDILPWSRYLTGVQGQDPGYDPLQFLITEAKARGLEVHAWFNPYRITTAGTDVNALAADHPARKNPEWVMQYGAAGKEQLLFNPGIPAVQQHVVNVVNEVVANYDIDAVHMDDYFYPYPVSGISLPDQDTFAQYGGEFSKIADWRRNNVNTLVRNIGESIKKLNPDVQFGISPFGIWRNSKTDPTGSATNGLANYDDLYADTRTWIKNEYIDYITPQLYWSIGYSVAEYKTLVDWWANEVAGTNVNLYIGHAIDKVKEGGANGWGDTNPDQISQQLAYNRTIQEVKGSMHFRYSFLMLNNLNVRDNIVNNFYNEVVPAPRLSNRATNQNDSLNLEKYTVSFELNGGKGDFSAQTVTNGKKFTIPTVEPTKTNYNFVGWYLDEGLTEKATNVLTVTDNVTLYAKWEEKTGETEEKYKVHFELNGGKGDFSAQTVTGGEKFTIPTVEPTKTNNNFVGWYLDEELTEKATNVLTVIDNVTLYAKWEEKMGETEEKYKVRFELNGGKGDFSAQTVTSGEEFTVPTVEPTKTNYNFVGWYLDEELTERATNVLTVTDNVTLYAKWEEKTGETEEKYKVRFELNGGKGDFTAQTVTSGEEFTVPTVEPTKTNNNFVGWYLDEKLTEKATNVLTVIDNVTLYAKWEEKTSETEEKYKVRFELNGGKGDFSDQTVMGGEKFTIPTVEPTKTNNNFVGWYLDEKLTEKATNVLTVTDNVTLYAKWEEKANETKEKYTVSFDLNEGSGNFSKILVTAGSEFVKPSEIPTRAGYKFSGWFSEKENGNEIVFPLTIDSDTVLYAHWSKEPVDNPHVVPEHPSTGDHTNLNIWFGGLLVISVVALISRRKKI